MTHIEIPVRKFNGVSTALREMYRQIQREETMCVICKEPIVGPRITLIGWPWEGEVPGEYTLKIHFHCETCAVMSQEALNKIIKERRTLQKR